jgi:ABC-type sugar transport system ATPase subunit
MAATEPILRVRGLTKRFPGAVALKDVNFDLRAGEVHALCGENGAGKSTLIKTLSGVYPHGSYEGAIALGGAETRFTGIQDAERAGFAVIYQELALVPGMTVAENIFLGAEPIRGGLIDWHRVYAETQQLLTKYGLDLDPAATVGELGVGQQQLVEIVKALSKNARIVLLDEPTRGIDIGAKVDIYELINRLTDEGKAVVLVSSELPELMGMSDRMIILSEGRIGGEFARGRASQEEVLAAAMARQRSRTDQKQAGTHR